MNKSAWVIGVDVGGTYTDVFALDEAAGTIEVTKIPSTRGDQSKGFIEGIARQVEDFADILTVVHGTTVGTNALLERKGAHTGIITTAGFRDVLEMRRRDRPTTWGLRGSFTPVVDRADRVEVRERVLADGSVLLEVDESEVIARARALADVGGLAWMVLDDFLYPGHSRHRMHALPEMSGVALEARLLGAAEAAAIPIVTEAQAVRLFKGADNRIEAVQVLRPDEATEPLRCGALILACNGFAGNPELVRENIPEIAAGPYYGHAGNTGDAVLWGRALGAELKHLSGYQGHGSLAHPHRILITWAVMMEGGIQVNTEGRRFANEHRGYSEQATAVLAQPGGVAWNIYDRERHEFALCFPDYREAIAASAIRSGGTVEALAEVTELPVLALAETLADVMAFQGGARVDPLQRDFTGKPPLAAPYYAVKVTGAPFHTQGGLMIDQQARVLSCAGDPFPNLFAGGGAACGVSGPHVGGYLSGNGLLSALAFGYLAGGNA